MFTYKLIRHGSAEIHIFTEQTKFWGTRLFGAHFGSWPKWKTKIIIAPKSNFSNSRPTLLPVYKRIKKSKPNNLFPFLLLLCSESWKDIYLHWKFSTIYLSQNVVFLLGNCWKLKRHFKWSSHHLFGISSERFSCFAKLFQFFVGERS